METIQIHQKIKRSEIFDFYENSKKELNDKMDAIKKVDKKIDDMVYKLYNLTDEEIKIVEGSVG